MDGNTVLDFGKVVLGALLGSGAASIGLAWWKHRGDSRYLALRLAVIFEGYASACSSLISRNGNAETPQGHEFPNWDVNLPTLPELPSDADGWKALDVEEAALCLGFASQIAGCQSVVGETIEHSPHDIDDVVAEEACCLGLQAWDLAVRLRSTHKLQPLAPRYDYAQHLREEQAAGTKRRQEAARDAEQFGRVIAEAQQRVLDAEARE
ncbi:hypothetical protein [Methylobacterium sp. WL9]|uniref:hypothetical protein n=1 Tax=Methylobacterium sp. WL9 TaxID=2603898 RepID=UPI0011CA7415|nr:hypothetical protein [Methylobacterium sp. WL9]TXN22154.1 hypothetical protein FV217_11815 [Methylobacterium sp. WL9]